MRVLVVDDNPDDRFLTGRTVAQALPGADIAAVGTPEELDQALADGAPDVAVLDFSLGWSTGLEVFRRLKAANPDCAAVLFTGSQGEEGAVEAMKAGIDDYVLKGRERMPRLRGALEGLVRRQAERRSLREAEDRYRSLFSRVGVGVFLSRRDGTLLEANPALHRLLGFDDLAGTNLVSLMQGAGAPGVWHEMTEDGLRGAEVEFRGADGRTLHVLLDVRPGPDRVEGLATDVTALRRALGERDLLMREVVHRVYNNLQLALTLVDMELGPGTEEALAGPLRRLAGRLGAVAAVQRRLLGSRCLSELGFDSFLGDVATAAHGLAGRDDVLLDCRVEAVPGTLDNAVAIGLIVNEAVANALKHAFPAGRGGQVTVRLGRSPKGVLGHLLVSDDGVGMPRENRGSGMGMRLLESLADQVDGKLSLETGPGGTSVRLEFPLG